MNLYAYIHKQGCLDSFIARKVIRIKLGETKGDINSRNRRDDQTGTPEAPFCVWKKENTNLRDKEFKIRFKDYRLRNEVTKELKEWYEFPSCAPDFDTALCLVKMRLDSVVGKNPFMNSHLEYASRISNEIDSILINIQTSKSKRESVELFDRAIEILHGQCVGVENASYRLVSTKLDRLYSIMNEKYGNSF